MNNIDLKNKSAIITGGGRGIGLAVVERFLQSGAKCWIWDRDEETLKKAAASLRGCGEVRTALVDVTELESIESAFESAVREDGQVHVVVNNAAIAGPSTKLWTCPVEAWREVIEVDLISVFLCCRTIVPHMIEKRYGRIVNIASIAGKEGNPNASHYSAAKAGVIALTKSLAKELATTGVLVNSVAPAVIQTDILKQVSQEHIDYMVSRIPMGRTGLPCEVAALVAWLSSDDCSFSTGAVYDLSGGRATY